MRKPQCNITCFTSSWLRQASLEVFKHHTCSSLGTQVTKHTNSYIKCNRTKHISPKLLYSHELEENDDIIVQQICSKFNLADLFNRNAATQKSQVMCPWVGVNCILLSMIWNMYSFSFTKIFFFIGLFS